MSSGRGVVPQSSLNRAACAACKHQRRKCFPDCPFARYFPAATHTQQFRDVHNLFGVSNLMKIYNSIDPEERDKAMESMIFEAETRRKDLVHGTLGIIRELNAQVEATVMELEQTMRQIFLFQRHEQMQQLKHQQQQQPFVLQRPALPPGMQHQQIHAAGNVNPVAMGYQIARRMNGAIAPSPSQQFLDDKNLNGRIFNGVGVGRAPHYPPFMDHHMEASNRRMNEDIGRRPCHQDLPNSDNFKNLIGPMSPDPVHPAQDLLDYENPKESM